MIAYLTDTAHNFMDTIKQKWSSFDISHGWYGPLLLYGGLGFVAGFLLKYLARPLLWTVLGTLLVLWLLNTLNLISIHHDAITTFLGFSSGTAWQEIVKESITWVQSHVTESIAFGVGFFLAWAFA